jgi:shikimate dehydrogenase
MDVSQGHGVTEWFEWRDAPRGDFAVVGDPISHTWSPRLHEAAYRASSLPYRYRAIRVYAEEFDDAIARLTEIGYRGVNVTLPLKEAAYWWAQDVDEASRPYGALNTLELESRRGTNTDAPGFLRALASEKIAPHARALVLGAGGSARTVARALVSAGHEVWLWNRTEARAEELARSFSPELPLADKPHVAGFHLLVNATSATTTGEAFEVDWKDPCTDALAFDLAYGPEPTPFVAAARAAGIRACDGARMLLEQAALSFEWWLGIPASREAMWRALS